MTKRIRPFANLCILIVLLLGACAPAPSQGATPTPSAPADPTASLTPQPSATPEGAPSLAGESITLYHFCASTGDLAAFNFSAIWAAQDMVASINRNGGVFGATLELALVDTQGTAAGAEAAYQRITNRDPVHLILICDAVTEIALAPLLAADDIPALGPGLAPVGAYRDPGGALYAYRSPAAGHFAAWLDHLAANWSTLRSAGVDDEIRLAYFAWPEALGGFLSEAGVRDLAAAAGVDVVQFQALEAERTANVYDLIYASRDANANALYLGTRAFTSAEVLNAFQALGLRQRFLIAGPDLAFDSLDAYLLDPAYLDGLQLSANSAPWSAAGNPAVDAAAALFTEADREAMHRNLAYLHSLGAVDIARHAIETVLLADGLDGLDAAALRQALNGLEDYAVLGGLYNLSYASSQRYPASLSLYQIDAASGAYITLDQITLP